jgi:hypothetical protein
VRYLVHFSDGGSGMRMRDEPLQMGCEVDDGREQARARRDVSYWVEMVALPLPSGRRLSVQFGDEGTHVLGTATSETGDEAFVEWHGPLWDDDWDGEGESEQPGGRPRGRPARALAHSKDRSTV